MGLLADRLRAVDPSTVALDNDYYEHLGERWWEPAGPMSGLHAMNPARLSYIDRVLTRVLGDAAPRARVIDVGCGGGILSESLAARGHAVIGFDVAEGALQVARRHAARASVRVEYRRGSAYALPLSSAAVDVVIAADVLEHLHDLPRSLAEFARVLRPGGVFVFDTIHRTLRSWLVAIVLAERVLGVVPPATHAWRMFITPDELAEAARRAGLLVQETRGLSPAGGLVAAVRSYIERGTPGEFTLTGDRSVGYIGHAVRTAGGPP
ncbi:bifunctional 2-polyprenyl-6-hydroxyphenol methylase/3-demethylubiquinol 3-O-methyltransferase UbiG [Nannocystis pusilla]|uniref:Bifunctional 2-polyprenyl-6-hydroxyphenol methylase/3-demethylubiquinol 3-O-methyltransferase UbiG n=1 Tax=Nannocystis pusilla TaxID=889268 RepID=A0ABS7U5K0_9BACT|nr:bifunctional 2-polyprenyl-6-hydroxyphenol methylase/3-demethylubiquinol 3-O-methyltransferase UbiG [Nannocystis pusilla]MBZ5715689.1 bifunctional 2-polyprenyl-6-hydroxyphenol methylase/3-demethylubiquinol 3-O-methyltransferase UbiG [Nannocystis pusilla]